MTADIWIGLACKIKCLYTERCYKLAYGSTNYIWKICIFSKEEVLTSLVLILTRLVCGLGITALTIKE